VTKCACVRVRVPNWVQVDACAAKVTTESAGGAGDQAWGARAFVLYDHIPVGAAGWWRHVRRMVETRA